MSKKRKIYTLWHLSSAVFMIAALAWLTVSAPFVYASQQAVQKHAKGLTTSPLSGTEEEAPNPLTSTTEEKKPGSTNSFSEEYLHDHAADEYSHTASIEYHRGENAGTYIAFHGELLVPPPNHC